MELIYPTKNEIMEFFKTHSGYLPVIRIAELLVAPHVDRSSPMDEEWKHIQGFLHQLKSQDFLLIQNEGQDIYNEKFSSTSDRIERYFNKDRIIDYSDLTQKTDDELQNIMRQTIDNSYVPSSVYNKAKQELEFRKNHQKPEQKWWEKTWVQVIMLLGSITGIIGLINAI